jgi:uncharacterized RDD family membrane protein YckC
MPDPSPVAPRAATPAALGWRLLAMTYDAIPLVPLALAISALFLLLNGSRPVTAPAGKLAMLATLWLACGAYFVLSWRRGGQTMGMRPWRLRVVDARGERARAGALWLRYAIATLSLAAAGLGFAWSLVDAERRTWHDLASGTVLVRQSA